MSDLYKIEKGIPVQRYGKGNNRWVTLAEKMQVGDSVLVNGRLETMSLRGAIVRLGFKCVTRGNNKQHTRVWKIER